MKIFNRGNDAAKGATAKAAENAPAPTGPAAATASVPAPPPAAPAGPDISAIIDANVKEMSEKIARLASSVEGGSSDRQQFEEKIQQMEDRMRKLSALTEMISAQYNPFVGSAPSESEPFPAPEIGLAAPAQAAAAPEPAAALMLTMDAPPLPPLDAPQHVFASPRPAPEAAERTPRAPAPTYGPSFAESFDALDEFAPEENVLDAPDAPQAHTGAARLWAAKPGFGSSMLLLSWADMLLKNAPTRESYSQLLEYYHNIGWIGDPARDQLLAYADGLAHAAQPEAAKDWRASVDVHEKSLLYLEKLRAIAEGRGSD